ncbi:MAG: hypothetical protein ABI700_27885, partial [Chloroflexota bacterium]
IAAPVMADPWASLNSVSRDGCTIILNVTVEDGGTYYVQVWDDGYLVDSQAFAASGGQTLDVFYTIKYPAGSSAPGVALLLADGATESAYIFDGIDNFIYPDDVANGCAAQFAGAGCSLGIPVGSVVGDLPFDTQAYWAPGKVSPDVIISAGKYWVVAQQADDNGNPYYKILLACQYLYVPAEAMSPSFEGPWNGEPLPSNVS